MSNGIVYAADGIVYDPKFGVYQGDYEAPAPCCCCKCLCDRCITISMSWWVEVGGTFGWHTMPNMPMVLGPNGASNSDENQRACTFCGRIQTEGPGDTGDCTSLTITFTDTKTLDDAGVCHQAWTVAFVSRHYDPGGIIAVVTSTGQLVVPIVGDCPEIDADQLQEVLDAYATSIGQPTSTSPGDFTIRVDSVDVSTEGEPCTATDGGCFDEEVEGCADAGPPPPPAEGSCDCTDCPDIFVGLFSGFTGPYASLNGTGSTYEPGGSEGGSECTYVGDYAFVCNDDGNWTSFPVDIGFEDEIIFGTSTGTCIPCIAVTILRGGSAIDSGQICFT